MSLGATAQAKATVEVDLNNRRRLQNGSGVYINDNSAENIFRGPFVGKHIVIDAILSDGDSDRTKRNNIMNPDFYEMASYTGDHPDSEKLAVVEFAEAYVTQEDSLLIENYLVDFRADIVEFDKPTGWDNELYN